MKVKGPSCDAKVKGPSGDMKVKGGIGMGGVGWWLESEGTIL